LKINHLIDAMIAQVSLKK